MRDWRVRRTFQPHPAGQRQWDRVYQQLLAWTQPADGGAVTVGPEPPQQEVSHESCVLVSVCRRQALSSSGTRRLRRRARIEMNAIATKAMRYSFERSKMVFNRR